MSDTSDKKAENWTREDTLRLISEYRKHVNLYEVTHPDYSNAYKNRLANEKITEFMKEFKPDVTLNEVKTKIRTLRQQIFRENMKMLRSRELMKTSADYIYEPRLWCFKELHFLLPANDQIVGESNIGPGENKNQENRSMDKENGNSSNVASQIIDPVPSKRFKSDQNKGPDLSRKPSEDEFHFFGLNVASHLRSMPLIHSLDVQSQITSILVKKRLKFLQERSLLARSLP